MAKDFGQAMDNGYIVPNSIAIGDGSPIDVRCQCDTVQDFKTFSDTTGFDIRYEGLITYEKTNKKLKVYKGNDTWEDVIGSSSGGDVDLSDYITLNKLSEELAKKSDVHAHPYKSDSYVPSWNEVTGKPTTFNPATHRHDASEIDNLPSGGGGSFDDSELKAKDIELDDKITVLSTKMNDHLVNHPSGESISGLFYNVKDYGLFVSSDDNSEALQNLVDLVHQNGGGTIFFPVGVWKFKKRNTINNVGHAIYMKDNVSIIGENIENTILSQEDVNLFSMFYYRDTTNAINGCIFSNFTVDGSLCTGTGLRTFGKAFYFMNVENCIFYNLILRGTFGTALGIDFLKNVGIDKVYCYNCGRGWKDDGTGDPGCSGVGIGTGMFENENFTVTNCICESSGQYGIFIETQSIFGEGNFNSKGIIIANNIVRNGRNKGIGSRGGKNILIANNIIYENKYDGIFLDNNCDAVKVEGNIIDKNRNGITLDCSAAMKNVTIGNNTIINNIEAGLKCTNLLSAPRECFVSNNNITHNSTGISILNNTDNFVFKGNLIMNNTTEGLNIQGVLVQKDFMFKENLLIGNSSYSNLNFEGITEYNDLYVANLIPPESIVSNDIEIERGEHVNISYTVIPSEASTDCTFVSEDTNIVLIDKYGKITGVSAGSSTITLISKIDTSIQKTINVIVNEKHVIPTESIELDFATHFTKGKKLMPDGSVSDDASGGFTEEYIDITSLQTRNINIIYNEGLGMRVCEYSIDKTCVNVGSSINNSKNFNLTLKENTEYIRIYVTSISNKLTVTINKSLQ